LKVQSDWGRVWREVGDDGREGVSRCVHVGGDSIADPEHTPPMRPPRDFGSPRSSWRVTAVRVRAAGPLELINDDIALEESTFYCIITFGSSIDDEPVGVKY